MKLRIPPLRDWPLAVRITVFVTVLIAGIAIVTTWINWQREQTAFREELQQQAEVLLAGLGGATGDALYSSDIDTIDDLVTGLGGREVLVFGRAYNAEGRILSDAFDSTSAFQIEADPFAQQILASEATIFVWQPDRLIAGQSVVAGRQVLGALSIGLPTTRLDEKLATIRNQGIGLALGTIALGVVLAVALSRSISNPIQELAQVTQQMAAGDMSVRSDIPGRSEIGLLSDAFNDMAAQLEQSISDLEQRTLAVTASAEISRRLSTLLNTSELVTEVVNQIQTAFGYYHAHIYLFDETGENLVMMGGTGEAGQEMLANKHQIESGQGLVGRVAELNTAVLVPDVSQEEGWLPNPLLPDTKAETAVPIIYGDDLLGVLDVQHNVVDGLQQSDVDLLGSIAAQVAIALQNARSYEQTQDKANREARFNEINRTIQSTTDLETALQVTVRELGRVLDAKQVRVQLQSGQNGRNHEGKI